MTATSFGPLSRYSSSRLLLSGSQPHGDSVRLKKSSGVFQAPDHLYLIYVSMDSKGLIVRHLWKEIRPADVSAEEDSLIRSARAGNAQATNFATLDFERPTYLTIILDVDGWDFYYPDPGNEEPDLEGVHDPIIFLESKSVLIPDPRNRGKWKKVKQNFVRNRAFYNCEPVVKRISSRNRDAIRCINFFTKDINGTYPVQGEVLRYGFNILIRIPFSSEVSKKITLIIDPDGTNTGPYPFLDA